MRRPKFLLIGPDGRLVGAPLIDTEGIVYADIDRRALQPVAFRDDPLSDPIAQPGAHA